MHGVASSARIQFRKLLLPIGDNAHRGGYDAEQFAVWWGDEKEEADDILLFGSELIGAEQKVWKNDHHADREIASLNDCNTI